MSWLSLHVLRPSPSFLRPLSSVPFSSHTAISLLADMGDPTHGHVEAIDRPLDHHRAPQTYWNHVKTLLTVAVRTLLFTFSSLMRVQEKMPNADC